MIYQRTIETILNLTTGEQINVDDLFKDQHTNEGKIFQLRTQIEKDLQNNSVELVCLYCKQPVAIRGRVSADQKKNFYFTHPYKSADCVIKTQSRLSEEEVRCIKYNGEKESVLHDALKRLIAHYLTLDREINNVKVDEVYKDQAISNKWRKPDVLADHQKIGRIAIELQLSTTFLSVIVGRSLFYQQQGIYLIWVFPNFSLQSDLQKFTQKDVFYNNNNNVYVFDKNAQARSEQLGKLMLTCYYQDFYIDENKIKGHWQETVIGLEDIHFINIEKFFYYDSEGDRKTLQKEIEQLEIDRKQAEINARTRRALDKIADYLKLFYKKDWLHESDKEHLSELIKYSVSATDLEERLKFSGDNAYVITKLFFERKKFNFLKFLCCNDKILFDTAGMANDGVGVFQEILNIEDDMYLQQYLACLFYKGYTLTEEDKNSLQQLYDENRYKESDLAKQKIERWATAKLYTTLSDRRFSFELIRLNKVLMAISSIKYKMIIGYRYTHLKQVAHYIFDTKKEYSFLFFRAVKAYNYYNRLLAEDKSGRLRERFDYCERTGSSHFPDGTNAIMSVFPELKQLHHI